MIQTQVALMKIELLTQKLRFPVKIKAWEDFFSCLPKMESHYCRIITSKVYLGSGWTKSNWFRKQNVAALTSSK